MRKVRRFYAAVTVFICLAGAAGADFPAQQETLDAIFSGNQQLMTRRLTDRLSGVLNEKLSLGEDDLSQMEVCADCIRFMELIPTNTPNRQTVEWILMSPRRLNRLVETVLPTDDLANCFRTLTVLAEYDPDGRDQWFDLMLALSVVWDVPERPPIHDQEGKKILPYKPAIKKRYDYFKTLYSEDSAKISYDVLTAAELIFVVDTPVPLSELEWVKANETGTGLSWGSKFYSIRYDHERLEAGTGSWPWGDYKLSEIKERGGICVDQAYYALMTARAFGIPAIYFHAKGTAGGHAWFSYMTGPGRWELNVGRYQSQKFTTGLAINPQTNGKMTDHDVAYTCESSLHSADFQDAKVYASIAKALLASDPRNALRCAQRARKLTPRYLLPWQIAADAFIAEEDCSDLLSLVSEQRQVFAEYPDIVIAAVDHAAPVLAAAGREEDAARLRRSLSHEVDDSRDDLHRRLGQKNIDDLVEAGDIRTARRKMETLMKEHIADGAKALSLIEHYLEITKETDETKSAARFLKEYADEFEQKNGSQFKYILLKHLLTAYENDGDDKEARLTRLQLNCYR